MRREAYGVGFRIRRRLGFRYMAVPWMSERVVYN